MHLSVGDLQVCHQTARFLAPFFREGLKVHLDLLRDVLPFLLLALGVVFVFVATVVLGILAFGSFLGAVVGFRSVFGLDFLHLVFALLLFLGRL